MSIADPMRYVSTRGGTPARDFASVLLAGVAPDGGLFVPETWPALDLAALPYPALAARVLTPFVGGAISAEALQALARDAYASCRHPATVPLVQLDTDLFVAELFHGPTLAFKDLALQLVGRLMDHVLAATGGSVTLIGATSGDTGSAAIAAVRGAPRLRIAVLHPRGRVSEVQRRQMTTVADENVLNIAVEGDFDDCQRIVKALFADAALAAELRLAAVNSINWTRIAVQIAYYVATALALGAPPRALAFAVPTGNFGNVFAGWAARRMGLPVARFIVASNRNDVLTRFFSANDLTARAAEASLSPSMDISVSSNFERLLFELLGRDGERTAAALRDGRVPDGAWREARALFTGVAVSDETTLATMRRVRDETGYVADPHTAVGIAAAREAAPPGMPVIALATAHPAKFPDTAARAFGAPPPVPEAVAALYRRADRCLTLPADLAAIRAALRAFAQRTTA